MSLDKNEKKLWEPSVKKVIRGIIKGYLEDKSIKYDKEKLMKMMRLTSSIWLNDLLEKAWDKLNTGTDENSNNQIKQMEIKREEIRTFGFEILEKELRKVKIR